MGLFTRRAEFVTVLRSQNVRSRGDVRDPSFVYTVVIAGAAILAFVFIFLWSRMTAVKLGYEISLANSERSALIEKNRRLTLEHVRLKSPERIEAVAVSELGLIRPTGERIVNVR